MFIRLCGNFCFSWKKEKRNINFTFHDVEMQCTANILLLLPLRYLCPSAFTFCLVPRRKKWKVNETKTKKRPVPIFISLESDKIGIKVLFTTSFHEQNQVVSFLLSIVIVVVVVHCFLFRFHFCGSLLYPYWSFFYRSKSWRFMVSFNL